MIGRAGRGAALLQRFQWDAKPGLVLASEYLGAVIVR